MNNNLLKAKDSLVKNGYTCVLANENSEYNSTLRGVKPLIGFLESGVNFSGFSAADKTVGAGAAHLYVLIGVVSVFANVISREGKRILEENGISVYYENLVPYIINRAGNGPCPIETAVKTAASSSEALLVIKETLKNLKG